MCRYGTSGHGLACMVTLVGRLVLMILEVFSNLNDSTILIQTTCLSIPRLSCLSSLHLPNQKGQDLSHQHFLKPHGLDGFEAR